MLYIGVLTSEGLGGYWDSMRVYAFFTLPCYLLLRVDVKPVMSGIRWN